MNKRTFLAIALLFSISQAFAALSATTPPASTQTPATAKSTEVSPSYFAQAQKSVVDFASGIKSEVEKEDLAQTAIAAFAAVKSGVTNTVNAVIAAPATAVTFVGDNRYSLAILAVIAAGAYYGFSSCNKPVKSLRK